MTVETQERAGPPEARHAARTPEVAAESSDVLLLGAGFTTNNMGVWALAASAIKAACHARPGARVRLLDYHHSPDDYKVWIGERTTDVELVNIRFSKKVLLRNNIARLLLTALLLRVVPGGLRDKIVQSHPALRAIREASFIGSIAGGDSFSDIYGLGRFAYVTLPQLLVLWMGKPLILLPQTLGPFRSRISRIVAKYIIRRASLVYARDAESLEAGRALAGDGAEHLQLVNDMAFVLEPKPPAESIRRQLDQLGAGRPLVGLNVSGLLYMGGYSRDNMFGLKSDYRAIVESLIEQFVAHDADVLLVPHVFGSGNRSESDVAASEEVFARMGPGAKSRLHKLDGECDHQEIKCVIGRCDFFLGSRMHACIAALSQGVPAVGLAYSRKFEGVFKSAGCEELVVDLRDFEREAVIGRVEKAFQSRAEMGKHLRDIQDSMHSRVLGLFTEPCVQMSSPVGGIQGSTNPSSPSERASFHADP